MIIVMHVYGQYKSVDTTLVNHSRILINAICNTGVSIFILISGYYGIRNNLQKWISLYNLTTFYGILFLTSAFFTSRNEVNSTLIVQCIFPVFCNKYWFVTSYLLLMALADYIQKMLDSLSHNDFLKLIVILSLFMILSPSLFHIEIFRDSGKGFMNMLTIYVIGRYLGKYGFPPLFVKLSKVLIPLIVFIIWFLIEITGKYDFCRDNNILITILAISIFQQFVHLTPKHNTLINMFAKFVFPIYLVHYIFLKVVAYFIQSTDVPYILQIWISIFIVLIVSVIVEFLRRVCLGKLETYADVFLTKAVSSYAKKLQG